MLMALLSVFFDLAWLAENRPPKAMRSATRFLVDFEKAPGDRGFFYEPIFIQQRSATEVSGWPLQTI